MYKFIEAYETDIGYVPLFPTIESLKFNERFGRIAYKSEYKITKTSAEGFLHRMTMHKPRHLSVLEGSNCVVRFTYNGFMSQEFNRVVQNPYLKTDFDITSKPYIGGSIRAWMEHLDFYDIKNLKFKIAEYIREALNGYMVDFVIANHEVPIELRKFAVRFICDRAFSHELVRHRVMSFLQESQRYVKYDTGVEIIKPHWWESVEDTERSAFLSGIKNSISSYKTLRRLGIHQQHARSVLPNATKTEVFVVGDRAGWNHLYNLRSSAGAHPDMKLSMYRLLRYDTFPKFLKVNVHVNPDY